MEAHLVIGIVSAIAVIGLVVGIILAYKNNSKTIDAHVAIVTAKATQVVDNIKKMGDKGVADTLAQVARTEGEVKNLTSALQVAGQAGVTAVEDAVKKVTG